VQITITNIHLAVVVGGTMLPLYADCFLSRQSAVSKHIKTLWQFSEPNQCNLDMIEGPSILPEGSSSSVLWWLRTRFQE